MSQNNSNIISIGNTLAAFTAFPNPTSGKLTISFGATLNEKYTLKVVDILGNLLLIESAYSQDGNNVKELDLSNLSKGFYFLMLEKNETEQQTIPIAVQ